MRRRRERLGLTQYALAELARTQAPYISLAETDKSRRHDTAINGALLRLLRERHKATRAEIIDRKIDRLWRELDGDAARALRDIARDKIISLYNDSRLEEGDALLFILPTAEALELLDWYFDEEPDPATRAAREER